MTSAQTSSFLFLALLLAVTAPYAHGTLIQLSQLVVRGQLVCTNTGNPILGVVSPPVVGANVTIACAGNPQVVVQTQTTATGAIVAVISNANINLNVSSIGVVIGSLLNLPLTCSAVVRLPVRNCLSLNSSGVLVAPISLVGVELDTAGHLSGIAKIGVFVNVNVTLTI